MKKLKFTLIAITIFVCFLLAGVFHFRLSHAQTAVTTISGKFYKLDVLATNTSLGIATIFPGVSINDNGVVAFAGTNNLFTADGIAPVKTIRSNSFYDPGVQINNNNSLVSRNVVAADNQQFLSRFDTNQSPASQTVIAGVSGVGFNDFSDIPTLGVGLNNSGQPVFSATHLNGTDRQLVTGIRPAFNRQNLATTSLSIRPAIADSGNIVVRAGNTSTSPIKLYNYGLTTSTDIATVSPTSFSTLGQSPGISDDEETVAFYGVNLDGGSQKPGIFISYIDGGVRKTERIGRRLIENVGPSTGDKDGVCDPGETACIDAQLGENDNGNVLVFSSFEPDARIGVIHKPLGASGLADDVVTVVFIGTPSGASSSPQYFSNQKGLWTIRVDFKEVQVGTTTEIRVKPSTPVPVAQVGDLVGTGNQITDISVYDPIALAEKDDSGSLRVRQGPSDHRVVFRATTQGGGTMIVRAARFDTDEDGLPDHWETSGIDFNQDGGIPDLQLIAEPFNSDPNRKDIFVEIDYMEGGGHTHRPGYKPDNSGVLNAPNPITTVVDSFATAPVVNPSQTRRIGIDLHVFVDESLPEINALEFPTRRPGANNDFRDLKFGSNGSPTGNLCGISPTDGHFGTIAASIGMTTEPFSRDRFR